jgi:hypothetical protein
VPDRASVRVGTSGGRPVRADRRYSLAGALTSFRRCLRFDDLVTLLLRARLLAQGVQSQHLPDGR